MKIIFSIIFTLLVVTSYSQSNEAKKKFNEANQAFRSGNLNNAIQLYQAAISLDKSFIKAYEYKAKAQLSTSAYSDAIKTCQQGLKIDVENVSFYVIIARSHHQLYEFMNAYINIEIAIKKDPKSAEAHATKGFIKLELDDFKGAIEAYTKAIELKPTYGQAYHERAISYKKMQNEGAACADWEKASNLGFRLATAQYNQYCDF